MKTFKYILLFLVPLFCFTECEDEDETPIACNITVETQEAKVLGNTSAELSFSTLNDNNQGIYKTGILYSTEASLINAKDEFQAGNHSSQFSRTIESLKRNTTYYFKGYVEDYWGNRIEGKALSFTTRNEPFSITTGGYTQTNAQYKYLGFTGSNGKLYNYEFNFTLYATLVNAEDVDSWGIVWFNDYTRLYYGDAKEGTLSGSFSLVSNSSSGSHTYQAFAKLKDGTYKYGEMRTIYYSYYKYKQ